MKTLLYSAAYGSILTLCSCATSKEQVTTTTETSSVHDNRPSKIINGKRYVYVAGELGSNIPGQWVPADSPAAHRERDTRVIDSSVIQKTQAAPGQGLPGGS